MMKYSRSVIIGASSFALSFGLLLGTHLQERQQSRQHWTNMIVSTLQPLVKENKLTDLKLRSDHLPVDLFVQRDGQTILSSDVPNSSTNLSDWFGPYPLGEGPNDANVRWRWKDEDQANWLWFLLLALGVGGAMGGLSHYYFAHYETERLKSEQEVGYARLRLQAMEREGASSDQTKTGLTRELMGTRQKLERLLKERDLKTRKLFNLTNKLAMARTEVEKLNVSVAGLEGDKERLENDLATKGQELFDLTSNLEQAKARIVFLQEDRDTRIREMDSLQVHLVDARAAIGQALQERDQKAREALQFSNDVSDARVQHHHLQQELQGEQQQRGEWEQEARSLQERFNQLEQERAELQAQLTTLQNTPARPDENLIYQLQRLQSETTNLWEENQRLKQVLERAETTVDPTTEWGGKDQEMANINSQLVAARMMIDKLTHEKDDSRDHVIKISSEIETLREQLRNWQQQKIESESELSSLSITCSALRSTVRKLTEERQEMESSFEQMSRDLATAQHKAEHLQGEVDMKSREVLELSQLVETLQMHRS